MVLLGCLNFGCLNECGAVQFVADTTLPDGTLCSRTGKFVDALVSDQIAKERARDSPLLAV